MNIYSKNTYQNKYTYRISYENNIFLYLRDKKNIICFVEGLRRGWRIISQTWRPLF